MQWKAPANLFRLQAYLGRLLQVPFILLTAPYLLHTGAVFFWEFICALLQRDLKRCSRAFRLTREIVRERHYPFLFSMKRHLAPDVSGLYFYEQARTNPVNTIPAPADGVKYTPEDYEALYSCEYENLKELDVLRSRGKRCALAISHYSVTRFQLYFLHKLLPDSVVFGYATSSWSSFEINMAGPQQAVSLMLLNLRKGVPIIAAFDGYDGDLVLPGKLLGLELLFARGLFVATRLAGAAVLPCCSYWIDPRTIKVVFGPAIDPAKLSDEEALRACVDVVNALQPENGKFQIPLTWTRSYVETVFRARFLRRARVFRQRLRGLSS